MRVAASLRRDPGRYALRAVAMAERRTGWRGLLLLGVLFGLVGGMVLGAVALAERTATAYSRLVDAVDLDDARVLVGADQPELAESVATMPGVERAWVAHSWVGRIDGPALQFVSMTGGAGRPSDLVHPVVLEGRSPAADAPAEVLLGEPLAEQYGLAVGDRVTLKLLTMQEISMFDVGFGDPDGPTVELTVVGIGRMPAWGGILSQALTSPAFALAHGGDTGALAVFVRLSGDPGAATAFADAFTAAAAAAEDRAPSAIAQYLPPVVELPITDVDPVVTTAEWALVIGLSLFAAVLAAGGLLVVSQGLLRHHAAHRDAQGVETALGMTAAERVGARVLAAGPAALAAAALAAGIALAAGLLEPLGSQARFEPVPGFRPPWRLSAGGAFVVAAAFLAVVALSAAFARGRGRTRVRAASDHPDMALRIWRQPALLLGVRLALGRRRAYRGIPSAATVLGATAATAGIVAAVVFGACLDRLTGDPARYGQGADLTLVDAREPDISALAADPRVAAVAVTESTTVRLVGGQQLPVTANTPRTGTLPSEVVAGREPAGPGEIAIGPRTAAQQGVGIGDVLDVQRPAGGGSAALTVTGIVVAVSMDTGQLDDVVIVAPEQLRELAQSEPLVSARILAAPGHADALIEDLGGRLEIAARSMPTEIRNLADLLLLPELLAVVLGVVAGAAMAHTLLTAAHRHARELAVLTMLGGTQGQARATLAVMACTTVLPALALGIPLGIGAGRVLWWQVATATGVAGDVAVPVGLLVVGAAGLLAAALLLAVAPALRPPRAQQGGLTAVRPQ